MNAILARREVRIGTRLTTSAALGAAALLVYAACAASAQETPEGLPFPAHKTAILRKDGAVYFVEGRVTIPAGVEVTILNDIKIVGAGEGATIEVIGSLVVHGVRGREVLFENVTIEPQETFKEIHMDMAILSGSSLKTATDVRANGHLFLELFDFIGGATADVTMASGSVELSSVCAENQINIRVRPPDGSTTTRLKVNIRGCIQGLMRECEPHVSRIGLRGGLDVDGGNEIVLRSSRVGGDLCALRNWDKSLIFDACKVDAKRLEITHDKAGKFAKAQFAKCDVYSPKMLLRAPIKKGKKDTAKLARFFFGGQGDPKVVMSSIVEDAQDDPEKNGVTVKLAKVKTRAHEMGGPRD